MKAIIRESEINDLDFLEELEKKCFPEFQQSTRRAIRYSLTSPTQKIIIAERHHEKNRTAVASATFYLFARTLRIFSIAVLPEFQGKGIGKQLLEHAILLARTKKIIRISLEVLESNESLIRFYKADRKSVV